MSKQRVLREKGYYCDNLKELKEVINRMDKRIGDNDDSRVEFEIIDNNYINFYWIELETDDEYKERLKLKEEEKNREYKIKYLKLKQEFEGENV